MKSTENLKTNYLERVTEKSREKTILKMDFGNILIVNTEKQEIKLVDNNKTTQLIISVKEKGLSLAINAFEINIHATDELNFSSKTIKMSASEKIEIKTDGDLEFKIEKDCNSEIGGASQSNAKTQLIRANLGNVEMKANDDVRLDGERVLFNCD